ncbi:uncharacterized protein SCHCODRAFT_02641127 [Schizophyllum commune H4-8]|uniref:uncharacterized protein n=1 Tax=Schizophyllum commune (strain H4-8 / FGSC 9210) TaxID=578458 RepID=UPI0021606ED9|nr:uncharacterized protein SCHCODRAFT_02641127 [Schizophyllum commune H4-8]KAI5887260.1 hypothetical protein SCHCODRAFT_02641127 [Schizophyllum commune H4-8]
MVDRRKEFLKDGESMEVTRTPLRERHQIQCSHSFLTIEPPRFRQLCVATTKCLATAPSERTSVRILSS